MIPIIINTSVSAARQPVSETGVRAADVRGNLTRSPEGHLCHHVQRLHAARIPGDEAGDASDCSRRRTACRRRRIGRRRPIPGKALIARRRAAGRRNVSSTAAKGPPGSWRRRRRGRHESSGPKASASRSSRDQRQPVRGRPVGRAKCASERRSNGDQKTMPPLSACCTSSGSWIWMPRCRNTSPRFRRRRTPLRHASLPATLRASGTTKATSRPRSTTPVTTRRCSRGSPSFRPTRCCSSRASGTTTRATAGAC